MPTAIGSDIMAREAQHVPADVQRLPVAFVRGEGVCLFDAEGHEYLDFLSGIGVAALGHAIRRWRTRSRIRRASCRTRRTCSSIRSRASSRIG